MPCDGVTVLNAVPVKVQNDLLGTEKRVNAIQNWLKGKNIQAIIGNLPGNVLQISFVNGGYIQISGDQLSYFGVADNLIQQFKPFVQKLSGYLRQQEVAAKIAKLTQVDSVNRAANGAVVMEVRI